MNALPHTAADHIYKECEKMAEEGKTLLPEEESKNFIQNFIKM